jgi:multiple sugar transport system substrate-binding protein
MSEQRNQHKYSRRDFVKVGTGLVGAALLSACAPTPTPQVVEKVVEVAAQDPWLTSLVKSDATGDFRIMSWEGEGEMRKWLLHIGKFFSKYYPNIKWNLDWGISWDDYWTKLPTLMAGGSPIEMVWMHDSKVHTFAAREFLLPLDDLLTAYPAPGWPDHFYKSQVESFVHNGKQYAFPYDWAPGGFYVNVDLFDQAGLKIPDENTTWDEIREIARKISKDTDDPKKAVWGLGGIDPGWTGGIYWIIKEFGGDYWTADLTKSMLNEPKTVEALQFLRDLVWKYNVHPSAASIQGLGLDYEMAFASGKIAMHYGLNDISFRINEGIAGKFKWTVAPTPTGPAGRFQFSGGSAFAIPKTSTQKDMAYELIRFVLANPDNLPTTAVMGGALVANKDFAEFGLPPASLGISDAFRHAFIEMGSKNPCMPNYHAKYLEWEQSVWATDMGPVWIGEQADVAAAAKAASDGTQKILESLAS